MSATPHASGAHGANFYVKIWGILCGLLVVSVLGPMLNIFWLTMVTAFGIAFVKAWLVATRFMHLDVEKRFVPYLFGTMLMFMAVMVAGTSPDILKHEGQRWRNDAAKQSVERGLKAAHSDEKSAHGHAP